MRIGDYLMDYLSGGVPVDTPGDALRVLLVQADGNVSQLARDLGRSRRTVRNWLAGTTPRGGGGFLVGAARDALTDGRLDDLRNGFDTVTIGGTLTISDAEARELDISFTGGLGDEIVDAYLAGAGPDQLERLYVDHIEDDWYRDHIGDPTTWDTDWMRI